MKAGSCRPRIAWPENKTATCDPARVVAIDSAAANCGASNALAVPNTTARQATKHLQLRMIAGTVAISERGDCFVGRPAVCNALRRTQIACDHRTIAIGDRVESQRDVFGKLVLSSRTTRRLRGDIHRLQVDCQKRRRRCAGPTVIVVAKLDRSLYWRSSDDKLE